MRLFELRKTKEELAAIKQAKAVAAYELWKSPQAVHDRAYDDLQYYKEKGINLPVLSKPQLFVPRGSKALRTKQERERHMYNDPSKLKYGFDDNGEIVKQHRDWINSATESVEFNGDLTEGAPILAGSPIAPGGDKPDGAVIWTSSATKHKNGTYSSNWTQLVRDAYSERGWWQSKGYLYKIKPGTCLFDASYSGDAIRIYNIFKDLGRGNNAIDDPTRHTFGYRSDAEAIRNDFPWHELSKHFDGIWYSGGYDSNDEFFRGWECESIAWFKSDKLQLLGQVTVNKSGRRNMWDEDDE
jgi:hypothetical protein